MPFLGSPGDSCRRERDRSAPRGLRVPQSEPTTSDEISAEDREAINQSFQSPTHPHLQLRFEIGPFAGGHVREVLAAMDAREASGDFNWTSQNLFLRDPAITVQTRNPNSGFGTGMGRPGVSGFESTQFFDLRPRFEAPFNGPLFGDPFAENNEHGFGFYHAERCYSPNGSVDDAFGRGYPPDDPDNDSFGGYYLTDDPGYSPNFSNVQPDIFPQHWERPPPFAFLTRNNTVSNASNLLLNDPNRGGRGGRENSRSRGSRENSCRRGFRFLFVYIVPVFLSPL